MSTKRRAHQASECLRVLKKEWISSFADRLSLSRPHDSETPEGMVKLTLIGEGRRTSITDAYEHCGLLHPDTLFDHIRAKGVREIEGILQAAREDLLDSAHAAGLLPNAAAFAFDIHVDPDYSTKHEGTIGWKDLPGTDYGMTYLSADCLDPTSRLRYAFTPIRQATNRADALPAQVARIQARRRITLALLDRGFANVGSFLVLAEPRIPFVTPMPGNRRIARMQETAWRERVKVPVKPYWYHVVPEHAIMESGKTGRSVTVQFVCFLEPHPKNKEGRTCFVFATNPGELKLERILELASRYRERWGIETGYQTDTCEQVTRPECGAGPGWTRNEHAPVWVWQ